MQNQIFSPPTPDRSHAAEQSSVEQSSVEQSSVELRSEQTEFGPNSFGQRPYADPVTRADTGLGTTFERWALNRFLTRLQAAYGLQRVLEGPGDGMTGIAGLNSLPLALGGAQVSLILPDPARAAFACQVWKHHAPEAQLEVVDRWESDRLPYEDGSFDLVWNFNVATRLENPQETLADMARVSRKAVLVFVPNRSNYAFGLHRLHHRVTRQPWDHGRVELMQPEPWRRMLAGLGLRVQETVWVDCPWWPDIVDFGQLLSDFFPPLKSFSRGARPENRMVWPALELPYYRPQDYPQVHRQMSRLAYFENSRQVWLKRRFAHHVGVLGIKS